MADLKERNIVLVSKDSDGVTTIDYPLTSAEMVEGLEEFLRSKVFLAAYPVGSLYWSSKSTDPATLFGGTWKQIKDKFILAAGDTYTVGTTGGEAAHTLTTAEMPSHNHSASSNSAGAHTHTASSNSTGAHTHTVAYGTGGEDDIGISGGIVYDGIAKTTSSAGSHSHAIAVNSNGAHTHTITVNSTGSDNAHNNMPPYVAYYCWERTA